MQPLEVDIPQGRLTVVTGVSGSGKTTMVLESLIPALQARIAGQALPGHVRCLEAPSIGRVMLIDATPIGINVRSTVATYTGVHDELRKHFARSEAAKQYGAKLAAEAGSKPGRRRGLTAGAFSYNTGSLRCDTCDGTGQISLDVQFLPDVEICCPDCRGSRYGRAAHEIRCFFDDGAAYSLPDLMAMSVDEALTVCAGLSRVSKKLQVLHDLGLGYLTLGEQTPGLSGGEAQRLKLASEMGRGQGDSVFVFDEPTIGLHPKDVQTLMGVFASLITKGATVVVIEHDLDVIRSADYVVDMGPGGGLAGGQVVATGSPAQIKACPTSLTGKFI